MFSLASPPAQIPKTIYRASSKALSSSVHLGNMYRTYHISALFTLLPPTLRVLRLRGNFVNKRYDHNTEQVEGLLLPCSNMLLGDNARAFYFCFIRSKTGLRTAVYSLGFISMKFCLAALLSSTIDKTVLN